jgi:hypothetical protein
MADAACELLSLGAWRRETVDDESFDVFCTNCNIEVASRVICKGHGGFSSANPFDEVDSEYYGDSYFVSLCRRCSSPFLVRQSRYGVPGEFETVTSEVVLYPNASRLPADGIPDPARRAYEQALRCYSAASYEACALMCRRCLEALCKSFSVAGNSLNRKVDALCTAGIIDKRLAQWAHGVRAIGNEAAHDTDAELSKDDARDAIDFTEALLMYVFALNARFAEFQQRRSAARAPSAGHSAQPTDQADS